MIDNKLQDAISRDGIVFGELYPVVLHSDPEVTHIMYFYLNHGFYPIKDTSKKKVFPIECSPTMAIFQKV